MADQPPQGVFQLTATQLHSWAPLHWVKDKVVEGQEQRQRGICRHVFWEWTRDKTKRFQQFQDWLPQAEAIMEFLNTTESKRKTLTKDQMQDWS